MVSKKNRFYDQLFSVRPDPLSQETTDQERPHDSLEIVRHPSAHDNGVRNIAPTSTSPGRRKIKRLADGARHDIKHEWSEFGSTSGQSLQI